MRKIGVDEFLLPWVRLAAMLLVYAALRYVFYAKNASQFPGVEAGQWVDFAYGGLRFDLAALLYLCAPGLVAALLTFRWKFTRAGGWTCDLLFFVPNALGLFLACADIEYYPFTLRRTTWNVLSQLGEIDNQGALWAHFVATYWPTALLFAALLAATWWLARGLTWRRSPLRPPALYAGATAAALALAILLTIGGIRGGWAHATRPLAMTNAMVYTRSAEQTAIVLNSPFCFLRTIGKNSIPPLRFFDDAELARTYSPLHAAPEGTDQGRGRNVVVFILESFSREFVGCLNADLDSGTYSGYTPFLDSLAQGCLTFDHAYANGRKSIDAMPSILASVPSLTLPFITCEYGNDHIKGLPALLRRQGYTTAFFHGAANGSMGFDSFAKQAGFQFYHGRNEYANDDDYDGMWGIWDHKFFPYMLDQLGRLPEPFMAALFSLSSHDPFRLPPGFEGRYPKGHIPVHQCIGYTDEALRHFFEAAAREPWFERTLFVLVADHNVRGDHEEYRRPHNQFAVPLFFYAPGDSLVSGRDTLTCQQADIMPSVLSYVGCAEPYLSFGNDLRIGAPRPPQPRREAWAFNFHGEGYQLITPDTLWWSDGRAVERAARGRHYDEPCQPGQRAESFIRAYLQQYNNRLVGDSLCVPHD